MNKTPRLLFISGAAIVALAQIFILSNQLRRAGDDALSYILGGLASVILVTAIVIIAGATWSGPARTRLRLMRKQVLPGQLVIPILLDAVIRAELNRFVVLPGQKLPSQPTLQVDEFGLSLLGGTEPVKMLFISWDEVASITLVRVSISLSDVSGISIEVRGDAGPYRIPFGLGRNGRATGFVAAAPEVATTYNKIIGCGQLTGWRVG